MSKAREQVEVVLSLISDELDLIAGGYRRKARYKRYSVGMRSAFANRAYGVERAKKVVQNIFPENEEATPQE